MRLPGLIAAAYQHETCAGGGPHLHTMCWCPIVNRAGGGAAWRWRSTAIRCSIEAQAAG